MFASQHGQPLHTFHSVDHWAKHRDSTSVRKTQRDIAECVDPVRTSDVIDSDLQRTLWNIPPSLVEHHAGILSLCEGMPVLLKNNEATELCATNGAEAIVSGWDAHITNSGLEVLDTLFVKLVGPPRSVQIEGLAENIVPLTKTSKRIKCILPNDSVVSIIREQLSVLPNFAMTDFGAQGRTRPHNVCHLKYCHTHLSLYTCLSRSSSLEDTIIVDDFDETKMTGGIRGGLRRELQQLEILNDITYMTFHRKLPTVISGITRAQLISAYLTFYGDRHVPTNVHPALDWSKDSTSLCSKNASHNTWRFTTKEDVHARSKTELVPQKKRRSANWNPATMDEAASKRRRLGDGPLHITTPVSGSYHFNTTHLTGVIWDSTHWSCAYDCIVTMVWNILQQFGSTWMGNVSCTNTVFQLLYHGMLAIEGNAELLESVRDNLRNLLFAIQPTMFPRWGHSLTALVDVVCLLFTSPEPFATSNMTCTHCEHITLIDTDFRKSYVWSVYPSLWPSSHASGAGVRSSHYWIEHIIEEGYPMSCSMCGTTQNVSTVIHTPPYLIILDVSSIPDVEHSLLISPSLTLLALHSSYRWRLVGICYAGCAHFTIRIITRDDQVWYHDGVRTGRRCTYEGQLDENIQQLTHAHGRVVCELIYALDDHSANDSRFVSHTIN